MARQKDRIYLPSGSGGLIRYGEGKDSKILLKPRDIVYFSIALGIITIILKFFLA